MTYDIVTTVDEDAGKEKFAFSDFEIMGERESKIRPGHTHSIPWGWGCPKCGTANRGEIEHGEQRQCFNCKLNVQLWGNVLYAWE